MPGVPTTRVPTAGLGSRRGVDLPQAESAAGANYAPQASLWRVGEVSALLGLSARRLAYWARTGLVAPSARTPGGHARYAFRDLVALRTAKRLRDAGVPLQRLRRAIAALRRALPEARQPLAETVLVASGDVLVVRQRGSAFEPASGQEWMLEVARFEREVQAFRERGSQPSRADARAGPVAGADTG